MIRRDLTRTFVYRMVHFDALPTLLERGVIHAPSRVPGDSRPYPPIHDTKIQARRAQRTVPVGPGGTIRDYVSFYLGRRSPMLLRLATGRVDGFTGSQDDLVYLVSSIADILRAERPFVFTDGHSLTEITAFFEHLEDLERLDWDLLEEEWWHDTADDSDRERRKQAEVLVHSELPWSAIRGLVVKSEQRAERVETLLATHGKDTPIAIRTKRWYYQDYP